MDKNKNERDRGSKQEESKVERKNGGPNERKQLAYTAAVWSVTCVSPLMLPI